MATSIYDNKAIVPNEEDLEKVLKNSYETWNHLIDCLEQVYGSLSTEWKFYSKNSGWCFKVSDAKRNLLFLLPNDDYFLVNINMSVKVGEQVLKTNISNDIKELIQKAKPYMEGISILIEIRNKNNLDDVKTVLDIRDK